MLYFIKNNEKKRSLYVFNTDITIRGLNSISIHSWLNPQIWSLQMWRSDCVANTAEATSPVVETPTVGRASGKRCLLCREWRLSPNGGDFRVKSHGTDTWFFTSGPQKGSPAFHFLIILPLALFHKSFF